jgi:hypothetical protein
MLLVGDGVAAAEEKARVLLRKTCDKKVWSDCVYLARHLASTAGQGERALQLLTRTCSAGHKISFILEAQLSLEQERGDAQAAIDRLKHACDADQPVGCHALGQAYDAGRGVPSAPQRAAQLYTKACLAKYAPGCGALARLYSVGRGVGTNLGKAAALHDLACKAGEPASCVDLAVAMLYGRGHDKDPVQAMRMLAEACGKGGSVACGHLAAGFLAGQGVLRDEDKAKKLFTRSCRGGALVGCHGLAGMLYTGRAGDPDVAGAAKLYAKTCRKGLVASCLRLAVLQRGGKVGPTPEQDADASGLSLAIATLDQCLSHSPSERRCRDKRADLVKYRRKRAKKITKRGLKRGRKAYRKGRVFDARRHVHRCLEADPRHKRCNALFKRIRRELPAAYVDRARGLLRDSAMLSALQQLGHCTEDTGTDCKVLRNVLIKRSLGQLWRSEHYWTREQDDEQCKADGCDANACADAAKAALSCMRYRCSSACVNDEGFVRHCRHPRAKGKNKPEGCDDAWWRCESACRHL